MLNKEVFLSVEYENNKYGWFYKCTAIYGDILVSKHARTEKRAVAFALQELSLVLIALKEEKKM